MKTVEGGSPSRGGTPPFELGGLGEGDPTPWPEDFKDFNTHNVAFWELGPLPVGSVLTFTIEPTESSDSGEPAVVAVLCTSAERDDSGIWVSCKFLGSDQDWGKQWGVSTFSRKKKCLHLCREFHECSVEPGHHVVEFGYWPVGKFHAGYVERRQRNFLDQFLAELKKGNVVDEHEDMEKDEVGEEAASKKLAELRRRLISAKSRAGSVRRSVSFAPLPARSGILKRRRPVETPMVKDVKGEKAIQDRALVVSSDSDGPSQKKQRTSSSKKSVGAALLAAVEQQVSRSTSRATGGVLAVTKEEKMDSARSRSRAKKKKKEKKKKKKKKSSSDGSLSESESSSSSSALKPPLQRKAEKKPGSVLKLLMDHVRLSLSDMSLADPLDSGAAAAVNSSAKITSYFQILVRHHLGNRPRDEKELYALAVSLDALRSGDIEKVADLLAGRYLAVETAAFEGSWETARWLEVARLEERGAAPAEVLLAARRHHKTLDRASGRGSFGRGSDGYWGAGHGGSGHWDDWAPTGRGKGKKGKHGKGKGKKGKAGKKGKEANWWDSHGHEVEKDGETKRGDAAK